MADEVPGTKEKTRAPSRTDEAEFLALVLAELGGLPADLPERLAALLAQNEDRAGAMRALFEELTGD